MRIISLFLFAISLFGQQATIGLVDPTTVVSVKDWTVGAYPQITTNDDSPHTFEEGNIIYIIGFGSQFKMNGRQRVHSVIDANNFTISAENGDPLNTWGSKMDVPNDRNTNHVVYQRKDRKEFAYIGKVNDQELTPHPRGIFPKDPALRARSTDPDGTGPLSAPVMSTVYGSMLESMANTYSSDATCNPSAPLSPTNCQLINYYATQSNGEITQGYIPLLVAYAWYANQQNDRWKNYGLAFLNNIHKFAPQKRGFYMSYDITKALGGTGEDSDYASMQINFWTSAFTLLRSEMSEGERETFAKRIAWDWSDGCTLNNNGWANGYISGYQKWKKIDGTLTEITVSGSTTELKMGISTTGMAAGFQVVISGADEPNLNGTFYITQRLTSGVLRMTTPPGVADGVYNNSGLVVTSTWKSGKYGEVVGGSLEVGDKIQIRGFSWDLTGDDIVDLVVSGTSGTITTRRNVRGSNQTFFELVDTGIENLDGQYLMDGTQTNTFKFSFTVSGVEPGTYTFDSSMKLRSNGAYNRYVTNAIVTEITPEIKFNVDVGAWNALFTKIVEPDANSCGLLVLTKTHTHTAPLRHRRMSRTAGALPKGATTLPIPNVYTSALEGMQTPFYVNIGGELMLVNTMTLPYDATSQGSLEVTRGVENTIQQPIGNTTVYGISEHGYQGTLSNESRYWVGPDHHNLAVTRFNACVGLLNVLDDLPSKRQEAEDWCNTFLMYMTIFPKEFWAGNNSSSTNVGYHYGRQVFGITAPLMNIQNSLPVSTGVETLWEHIVPDQAIWILHAKYPMSDNTRFMFSDSGADRLIQARNMLPQWMFYLSPGDDADYLNYFYYDVVGYTRILTGLAGGRQLVPQMIYNVDFDKGKDFRTELPLGKVFTSTAPGSREMGKGVQSFHSRTDWNDKDATAVYGLAISPNGDHSGGANRAGAIMIAKRSEVMCAGTQGCVSGANNTGLAIQQPSSLGAAGGAISKAFGRVLLTEAAPAGGVVVQLTPSNNMIAVPPYVTVPAGEKQVSFPTYGYQNPVIGNYYVTAESGNTRVGWVRVLNNAGGGSPTTGTIASVNLPSTTIKQGGYQEVTVTLSAPAGSGGVNLTIATTGGVKAPAMARIRAGQTTTQFAVSMEPGGISGNLEVTSANTINTAITSEVASPNSANLVGITWGAYSPNFGTWGDFAITRVRRQDVGDTHTYWQVEGNRSELDGTYCGTYSATLGTCSDPTLSSMQTNLLHVRPKGSQDYVIQYATAAGPSRETDRPGAQRIYRLSFYRGPGTDASASEDKYAISDPPDEGEVNGRDIRFTKYDTHWTRSGGVTMHTRVLKPDASAIEEEGLYNWNETLTPEERAMGYRINLWGGSGKAGVDDDEYLWVGTLHTGEHLTPVDSENIDTISSNATGVIINENPSVVAIFPKVVNDGETSYTFSVAPDSAGRAYVSGLSAGQYLVERNSVTLASNVCVNAEGFLTFDFPSGAGDYEITRTSTDPCTKPQEWITSSLPAGLINTNYSVNLKTSNSSTFTLDSGSIPTGFTLDTDGKLSGTTATAGTYTFSVTGTDGTTPLTREFELVISAEVGALVITNTNVLPGQVGVSYPTEEDTYCFSATGGVLPYIWSISSGSLPFGLTIDSGDGCLVGVPEVPGSYSFTVRVTDGAATQTTKSFTMSISGSATEVSITTDPTLPTGIQGTSYNFQINATGGTPPYTWSLSPDSQPSGISIDNNGNLTVTPSSTGDFTGTIIVEDSNSITDSLNYTLHIDPSTSTLSLNTGGLTIATYGQPYAPCVTATGGSSPYTFGATGLPAGLTINPATGCFSGAPSTLGRHTVSLTVTDAETTLVTEEYSMVVHIPMSGGISGATVARNEGVLLTIRSGEFRGNNAGQYVVYDSELNQVSEGTFEKGLAIRQIAFTETSTDGPFHIEFVSGNVYGSAVYEPVIDAGTTNVTVRFGPQSSPDLTFRWGTTTSVSNTDTKACSTGCEFTITGATKGVPLYMRWGSGDPLNPLWIILP
jgi:hypothetical protein